MSSSNPVSGKRAAIASIAVLVAVVTLGAIGLPSTASDVSSHADITVTFAADDMGFNATSTNGISNIILAPCVGASHTHESTGLESVWYNHTETFVIYAVYVKSGNNGVHGVGEQFLNAGVVCATPPVTTPPSTPPSTTPPSTPPPACPAGAARLSSYSFRINGGASVATLNNTVDSGYHVLANFTVAAGCEDIELALVSYKAPSASFSASTAHLQAVHESETGNFSAGPHSMSVDIPACFFQVDFAFGAVITQLGPEGSDNFYSAQGRLISADNGGTEPCDEQPPGTTPPASTTPPATTPPATTTSEVPFFPSMTALALGTVGALGGALLMLRRRN